MSSTSNAAGILIQHKNKFLLCKRAVFGLPLDGLWCIPAGTQEEGEAPSHTALRELYEETEISLLPTDLGDFLTCEERSDKRGKFFLYHYYSPTLLHPTLNFEHEGYAYFTPSELPVFMLSSTRDTILSLTTGQN